MSATLPDLVWLEDLLSDLPALPKPRRSIFELAGIEDRELTVSNMLNFYLNAEEQHNFGTLFFKSLMRCLEEEHAFADAGWDDFGLFQEEQFEVHREWPAKHASHGGKGSIDIVLTGSPVDPNADPGSMNPYTWAILVENKLLSGLGNPFTLYEEAVVAEKKICTLLVVACDNNERAKLPASWHVITHAQLVTNIRRNLSDHFDRSDDRHLLMLKEYFLNIDRLYMTTDENLQRERLNALHRFADQTQAYRELRKELAAYAIEIMDEVFKENGLLKTERDSITQARNYYPDGSAWCDDNGLLDGIKLWVDANRFIDRGELSLRLELEGRSVTQYGGDLWQELSSNGTLAHPLSLAASSTPGYDHFWLVEMKARLDEKKPLKDGLREVLQATVFANGSQLLKDCYTSLKKFKAAKAS